MMYKSFAFCQALRLWATTPSLLRIDFAIRALAPGLQTNKTALPLSHSIFDFFRMP